MFSFNYNLFFLNNCSFKHWKVDFSVVIGDISIPSIDLPPFDLISIQKSLTAIQYEGLALYNTKISYSLSLTYSLTLSTEVKESDYGTIEANIKTAFLLTTTKINPAECFINIALVEESIDILTRFIKYIYIYIVYHCTQFSK